MLAQVKDRQNWPSTSHWRLQQTCPGSGVIWSSQGWDCSRQSSFPAVSPSSGVAAHLGECPTQTFQRHWALRANCLDKEQDVTFAKVPAEVGADLNGSHHSWVGAEGELCLGDDTIPKLPESSGGQCSPAAFPRLHKLCGDFQLFPPLQPRLELEEESSSPTLLSEEHKAPFLSSKACFSFHRQPHQPGASVLPAPQVPSHAKQELPNCMLSFKCPLPEQNRQLERPSCAGMAAWQEAHSREPGYFCPSPSRQQ